MRLQRLLGRGKLAFIGKAPEASSDPTMIAAEHGSFPRTNLKLPWNYPKAFPLLLAPFAALPCAQAWLLRSAVSFGRLGAF